MIILIIAFIALHMVGTITSIVLYNYVFMQYQTKIETINYICAITFGWLTVFCILLMYREDVFANKHFKDTIHK